MISGTRATTPIDCHPTVYRSVVHPICFYFEPGAMDARMVFTMSKSLRAAISKLYVYILSHLLQHKCRGHQNPSFHILLTIIISNHLFHLLKTQLLFLSLLGKKTFIIILTLYMSYIYVNVTTIRNLHITLPEVNYHFITVYFV